MLDIKFLRENPDIVKQNIKNKFQDQKLGLVDEVIELDAEKRKTQQEAERYFQLCLFDAVNLCGCLVGKRSPCDDVLHLAPFLLHIRYKRDLCPRPYEVVLRVSGFEVGIAHQVIGEKTDAAFEGH